MSASIRNRLLACRSVQYAGAVLWSLLGSSAVWAQQDATPTDQFDERLDVVEVSVLVEFPDLDPASINRIGADDLEVTENEALREVSRLVPLRSSRDGEHETWNVLIYVDDLLSHSRTLELTLRALSERASTLVALGPVTVLLAGANAPVLDESVSIVEISDRLEELAKAGPGQDLLVQDRLEYSRGQRGLSGSDAQHRSVEFLRAEQSLLRSSVDRALVAGTRCAFAPCLMIWVSDGFDASAAYYPSSIAAGANNAQITAELARGLSAQGWTVLATALRTPLPPIVLAPEGSGTDYDAWKRDSGGVQMERQARKKTRIDRSGPEAQEMWILPRFEPHRKLIAATAGGVARVDWQLDEELERLDRRWWLLYQRPSLPLEPDDALDWEDLQVLDVQVAAGSDFVEGRRVAVRLGTAKPIVEVRAPRFTRRGSLQAVASALVRRFDSGGSEALWAMGGATLGRNLLQLALFEGEGFKGEGLKGEPASEIRWSAEPVSDPSLSERPRVPVRSTVLTADGGIEVETQWLPVDDGVLRLDFEPATNRAVLIEELGSTGAVERFGLLDLTPAIE